MKPAIVLGELLLKSSYRQRKLLHKNFKWLWKKEYTYK